VREHGASARTFKSALIFAVAESATSLRDEGRKLLAWEDISRESDSLRLEEEQRRELFESLKKAQRDLTEGAWRAYKSVVLLGRDNKLKTIDLGLVHSSAAESLTGLILSRLKAEGDLEESISPNFLVRNWPPAFTEWSTKAVRDAFFASPQFPRMTNPDAIKDTIARGVEQGQIAYVGRDGRDGYEPFCFGAAIDARDIEISDEVFIITRDVAEAYSAGARETAPSGGPPDIYPLPSGAQRDAHDGPSGSSDFAATAADIESETDTPSLSTTGDVRQASWSGTVTPLQWMNFYMKVLTRFVNKEGIALELHVDAHVRGDISEQQLGEMRQALHDLGLDEDIQTH
jgi:hypothetical protein